MGDEIVNKLDLVDIARFKTVNSRFKRKFEDVKGEVGFVKGFNQRGEGVHVDVYSHENQQFLIKLYGSLGLIQGFMSSENKMEFSLDDKLKLPLVNVGERADSLMSCGNLSFLQIPNECSFIVNPFRNVENVVKFINHPIAKSYGVELREHVKLIVDKEDLGLGHFHLLYTKIIDETLKHLSSNKSLYVSPEILKTFNDLEPPRPDWKLAWTRHHDDLTDDWKNYLLVSNVLDDKIDEINKPGQAVHRVMNFMVMEGTVNFGLATRIGDAHNIHFRSRGSKSLNVFRISGSTTATTNNSATNEMADGCTGL
nr:hypothetical protein [Tanacetum cinerariifolium]